MSVRLLLVLLVFLLGLQGRAAIQPTSELAVFKDPAGRLSITDVVGMDPARFRALPSGTLTAGFTHDTSWIRLTIRAPAGEWWLDVLPPVLDDLRLYEPDRAHRGAWIERRTGDMLPFSVREVPYRGFVLKLRHDSQAPRVYDLRLHTDSSSLMTTRLLTPEAFIARTTLETGLMVASIVVLLIVALLNLNNWLWLRDAVTPWFVAQMLCLAGYFSTSSGLAQQYLWPDSPSLNYAVNTVFVFLLMALCAGQLSHMRIRRVVAVGAEQPGALVWQPIRVILLFCGPGCEQL